MSRANTCGERLIDLLAERGVDTVFGIPGVHTIELYRGLVDSEIRHVQVRHEQGAGFMADGYARVSGRPGVCTLISGPGVTNVATPLAQAYADSIPLLLITSIPPNHAYGKGWGLLHDLTDQRAVTAPMTALSAVARSTQEVPELIAQAFAIFESGRSRPVHISIPLDVLSTPVPQAWPPIHVNRVTAGVTGPVEAAVDLLMNAKRPVLCIGGGATGASTSVIRLAEMIDGVVISTHAGKGIVPESHPLSLRASLDKGPSRALRAAADVVLAVGTEMAEADSYVEKLEINGKLIRVDIDFHQLNSLYVPDVPICGDASEVLELFVATLQERQYARRTAANAVDLAAHTRNEIIEDVLPFQAKHPAILGALRAALPDDAVVMGDITQIVYESGGVHFPVERPRCWSYPGAYCPMGCALPMAIGAKLAAPERPVAALTGDGSVMFTIQDLCTAVDLQLAIPILIWKNDSFGAIRDAMEQTGMPPIATNLKNPDFVALAKACHADAAAPESLGQLIDAIGRALLASGPTIIVVDEKHSWDR